MKSLAKFTGPDLDSSIEFAHPNVWTREQQPTWSRLVIGAREREIPLILELCKGFDSPFGVLYVLIASRCGHEDGRYQNPGPISYGDLELFLYTFQEFFEQDGRHHLWVASTTQEGQFIFDHHNVIYAYGDLDRYELKLESRGFNRGVVETPTPHSHNFHAEFDRAEDEIISYWEWKKSPLKPSDS